MYPVKKWLTQELSIAPFYLRNISKTRTQTSLCFGAAHPIKVGSNLSCITFSTPIAGWCSMENLHVSYIFSCKHSGRCGSGKLQVGSKDITFAWTVVLRCDWGFAVGWKMHSSVSDHIQSGQRRREFGFGFLFHEYTSWGSKFIKSRIHELTTSVKFHLEVQQLHTRFPCVFMYTKYSTTKACMIFGEANRILQYHKSKIKR